MHSAWRVLHTQGRRLLEPFAEAAKRSPWLINHRVGLFPSTRGTLQLSKPGSHSALAHVAHASDSGCDMEASPLREFHSNLQLYSSVSVLLNLLKEPGMDSTTKAVNYETMDTMLGVCGHTQTQSKRMFYRVEKKGSCNIIMLSKGLIMLCSGCCQAASKIRLSYTHS